MLSKYYFCVPLFLAPLQAQIDTPGEPMAQVLKRLDALEGENRRLAEELRALKQELATARPTAAGVPPLAERVEVAETRVAEQAQTKVESSQKFPLSLSGMLLFNAFSSGRASWSAYGLLNGPERAGATVGQSIIGLQFQGPSLAGNGRVNGSLSMDFWGAWSGAANEGWFRIREADLSLDWKNRSVSFGQMKPLIAPLQPTSLAEVGTPPLAGSGNLWFWLPQARYEERWHLNSRNGVTLQGAVMQTNESAASLSTYYASSLQRARPAAEGRAAFWHKFDETRRLEIGSGFHASSTRVAGLAVPSHITSVDWSITPFAKLQLTGTFYRGRNVASLGSLGNGFVLYRDGSARAVQATAGWAQLAVPVTGRVTFNLFGGIESDNGSYGVTRNFTYAANTMYHFGPNVVLGVEALQTRFGYFSGGRQLVNHYDLALAYLF
jgi:hypothetical protein